MYSLRIDRDCCTSVGGIIQYFIMTALLMSSGFIHVSCVRIFFLRLIFHCMSEDNITNLKIFFFLRQSLALLPRQQIVQWHDLGSRQPLPPGFK